MTAVLKQLALLTLASLPTTAALWFVYRRLKKIEDRLEGD